MKLLTMFSSNWQPRAFAFLLLLIFALVVGNITVSPESSIEYEPDLKPEVKSETTEVIPSPTPTPTPTPTPNPTPTPLPVKSQPTFTPVLESSKEDSGKQQALKEIDNKIGNIDQKIKYAQSVIDSLLAQEQQDTCNTDRYSDPESEMYIRDPYTRETLCAGHSQQYFHYINQIQLQINTLVQERNELERQKFLIMSQ